MDRLRVRTITTGLGAMGTNGSDDGARDGFSSSGVFLFYFIYIYLLIWALHSISTRSPPSRRIQPTSRCVQPPLPWCSTQRWQKQAQTTRFASFGHWVSFLKFTSCFFVITNAFILTKVLGTTYKMLYSSITTTTTRRHVRVTTNNTATAV